MEPAPPFTPRPASTPSGDAAAAKRAEVAGHRGPPQTAEAALRSSQLVIMVLIIGLLIGGGALGFLGLTRAGAAGGTAARGSSGDVLTIVVVVSAVLALAIAALGPKLMLRGAQRRFESRSDDDAAMRRAYQEFMSASVLRGAALELPGLLGAVATMLTGNWLMLLATLGSVVALAATFPRGALIERWLDEVTGGEAGGGSAGVTGEAAESGEESPENS